MGEHIPGRGHSQAEGWMRLCPPCTRNRPREGKAETGLLLAPVPTCKLEKDTSLRSTAHACRAHQRGGLDFSPLCPVTCFRHNMQVSHGGPAES